MAWGLTETAGSWCKRVTLHGEELKLLSKAMHEGVKQALHGTESLGEQECLGACRQVSSVLIGQRWCAVGCCSWVGLVHANGMRLVETCWK